MTTIWDIYEFLLFVTDKARNGSVSPGDVSKSLEAGQQVLFDKYWMQGGGRVPLSPSSEEALAPFVKLTQVTATPTGFVNRPGDFAHFRDISDGSESYRLISPNQVKSAVSSELRVIEQYPRYMFRMSGANVAGIQVFPATNTKLELDYYATPASPLAAFTTQDDEPVYDPTNSVQLTFDRKYWMEVIHASLPYIGVKMSQPDLYALSSTYNAEKQANP